MANPEPGRVVPVAFGVHRAGGRRLARAGVGHRRQHHEQLRAGPPLELVGRRRRTVRHAPGAACRRARRVGVDQALGPDLARKVSCRRGLPIEGEALSQSRLLAVPPRDQLPLSRVGRLRMVHGELLDQHRPAQRRDQIQIPGRELIARDLLFGQATSVVVERVTRPRGRVAPAGIPPLRADLLEGDGGAVRGRIELAGVELRGPEAAGQGAAHAGGGRRTARGGGLYALASCPCGRCGAGAGGAGRIGAVAAAGREAGDEAGCHDAEDPGSAAGGAISHGGEVDRARETAREIDGRAPVSWKIVQSSKDARSGKIWLDPKNQPVVSLAWRNSSAGIGTRSRHTMFIGRSPWWDSHAAGPRHM